LLVFPILLIAALGAFQFAESIALKQAVVSAAEEGAREAAKGAEPEQVADVVQTMLGPYRLAVSPTSGVRVDVERGNQSPATTLGDSTLPAPSPSLAGSLLANEFRVTVQASGAAVGIPDLLSGLGVSLADRTTGTAIARGRRRHTGQFIPSD
jgi:Flp pilus assembly protein TadG